MSLNGFADGPAVRTGPPIVDIATGMSACNAILLALLARDRHGRGQHVEVALFDIAMGMTSFYGMAYLINGENPGRFGNSPSGSPTVGVYEASDGPLYIACANDRLYRRLVVEVLNRPDLITDPQFATRKARSEHKELLRAAIAEVFCKRYPRELDGEDEARQHPGRLSPDGRGGVQCTGGARAPSLEPDSASYGGVGPEHRATDYHEPDRFG
ncbi:crotonobetainyl-CoA:carnitine CoA-transferase CaiB-like acyl-CoA transferase [Bradyrhizobium sp. LM6.10]